MVSDEYPCRKAEDLCRKVQEEHGWSLSFEGDLTVVRERVVNQEVWIPMRAKPRALLVRSGYLRENDENDEIPKSYGFLDLSQKSVIYQPAAIVYPRTHQRNAFHRELLSAIILHLRQLPRGVRPMVQLPDLLKDKVHPQHFTFLEMNIEYHRNGPLGKRCRRRCRNLYHRVEDYRPLPILDYDRQDIRTALKSCLIQPC